MVELRRQQGRTSLYVANAPFLILGGELQNSTASSMESLDACWERIATLHLNTLLLPVYWELVEPDEGRFDFSLVSHTISWARRKGLRLILLWFGTWKNSMSCYAPDWVKTDTMRFFRARDASGDAMEIVSPFCEAALRADARAFRRLMAHIRNIDEQEETVLMMQVENEIGMLNAARDHSPEATEKWNSRVPHALVDALQTAARMDETPTPSSPRQLWLEQGARTVGTWPQLFGVSLAAEELFMAWYYGKYVDTVATEGREEYNLPLFVNAALNRPGRAPGEYPSAGPLPHLCDIWRTAAPTIDLLAPDIYFSDFDHWCAAYSREDNPLFIPETQFNEHAAAHALYSVGHYMALGFSPFAIDTAAAGSAQQLSECYRVLSSVAHLIQGATATSAAKLVDTANASGATHVAAVMVDGTTQHRTLALGGYDFYVRHDYTWEHSPGHRCDSEWPRFAVLVIALNQSEFLLVGQGTIVVPARPKERIGLLAVEEGTFEGAAWRSLRRLNGDETHQGRHVRLPPGRHSIQRVSLYTYA